MAGVCLGIGTLLWVSDEPGGDPVLRPAASSTGGPGAGPAPEDDVLSPTPTPLPTQPATPAPAPPAVPAQPAPTASASPTPALVVPVTVLNNSRYQGLAARAAARFEAAGWPVAETGNLSGRTPATTVYYASGQEASAREFARRFAGIVRVLPRYDGLPGDGLTVVLTRDFAS